MGENDSKRCIALRPCPRPDGLWLVASRASGLIKSDRHASELDALVYCKTRPAGEFAYFDLDPDYRPQTCTEEFLTQYLATWQTTDPSLREAAEEYHKRCEEYDQTVCSLRTKEGVAMPFNNYERRQIDNHAKRVLAELCERLGVSQEELLPEIRDYTNKTERKRSG